MISLKTYIRFWQKCLKGISKFIISSIRLLTSWPTLLISVSWNVFNTQKKRRTILQSNKRIPISNSCIFFINKKKKVNGHSLLGVKLSEAQSYLIKSSDYVCMVICDGFNVSKNANETSLHSETLQQNGTSSSSLPFPRPPPVPAARQHITNGNGHHSNGNGNGVHNHNGYTDKDSTVNNHTLAIPNKLPVATSSSSCNYDNLRSIDSDDSHLTSPDVIQNYNFNSTTTTTMTTTSSITPKMPTSISFTQNTTNGTHLTTKNGNGNHNSTPINPLNAVNQIHQQQANSLPITDKHLMSNIMNKSNNVSMGDPKSQSMFTHNNNNSNTPVAPSIVSPILFASFFFARKIRCENFYLCL